MLRAQIWYSWVFDIKIVMRHLIGQANDRRIDMHPFLFVSKKKMMSAIVGRSVDLQLLIVMILWPSRISLLFVVTYRTVLRCLAVPGTPCPLCLATYTSSGTTAGRELQYRQLVPCRERAASVQCSIWYQAVRYTSRTTNIYSMIPYHFRTHGAVWYQVGTSAVRTGMYNCAVPYDLDCMLGLHSQDSLTT